MNRRALSSLLLVLPFILCMVIGHAMYEDEKFVVTCVERCLSANSGSNLLPIAKIVLGYVGQNDFGWINKQSIQGKLNLLSFWGKQNLIKSLTIEYLNDTQPLETSRITFHMQCNRNDLLSFKQALRKKEDFALLQACNGNYRLQYMPNITSEQGIEKLTLQQRKPASIAWCPIL